MSNNNALNRLNLLKDHISRPTGSIDLEKERSNASFNVEHMNWLFCGSKESAKALSDAYQMIQRDPDLYIPGGHSFDMTQPQQRELVQRQALRFQRVRKTLKDPLLYKALELAMCIYSETFSMKTYVHNTLFRQSIEFFGTKEQQDEWMDDVLNWRIIGSYAMTELGHSSFIRGLETTATYDRVRDEFIINTPTLTATKWWIGMAGQTATHTVAICQTIIDSKSYGIDWFIVPLRDRKTGQLLPGVTAGDIGAKYGRNGLDSGWIQFSNVRIPRKNMLMKWSKVTEDGNYISPQNPAIAYTTLIGERLTVLAGTQNALGRALTVACRYGCVRRQGVNNLQIMDYQTHYVKLVPCVASIYVINIVDRNIKSRWEESTKLIQTNQSEFLKIVTDIHATSSGLKGTITWWGSEMFERCRRSLGGHAYSSYNAIGPAIGDWGVNTTGGGDNSVLLQQTARYLMNSYKEMIQGKQLSGSVEYFNNIKQFSKINKSDLLNEKQLYDMKYNLDMYTWLVKQKEDSSITWNNNQISLIRLSELHIFRYCLSEYIQGISKYRNSIPEFQNLCPILTKLGQLWSIHLIYESLNEFLEEGYFGKEQAIIVRNAYFGMCKELRKEIIPLVDAWGYPDFILQAPLGKFDGDVYKGISLDLSPVVTVTRVLSNS
ncbi:14400_t:CDS:10 [Cetraspora pellucida]|uniref:14400_t:CDS:1 n=1 Tax=Cetraspora pellucida TaxID=1433469 RepID=A0ACA9K3R9_9GLOM|nr:14400_t:CDS:10 [Cetraspora pellucida]